jgi:hypothetical protein
MVDRTQKICRRLEKIGRTKLTGFVERLNLREEEGRSEGNATPGPTTSNHRMHGTRHDGGCCGSASSNAPSTADASAYEGWRFYLMNQG